MPENNPGDGRTADVLRQVFPGLAEHQIGALLQEVDTKTYPRGVVLVHEGHIEHTFYIVLDGKVDITVQLMDGQTRHLTERTAGQFFGEMALIENKPRTATVTTTEESTVIEISKEVFDQLLRRNASAAISVLRALTANLRASDQATIADLSRKNFELQEAYRELKEAQAELVAKERLERELEIAGEVQQSMLPDEFPDAPGWMFAGLNVPARAVGGDLYDVIQLDDDHLGLLLADVADKSVHAALFMAVTRALFHSESQRRLSPRETAQAVHRGILRVSSKQDMFVTAFYGVLHSASGRLRYVRAGQDFPLLVRGADGELAELDAQGRFLGMLEDLELEEREITLAPGDLLLLFSDGVPDAVDLQNTPYGIDRLRNLARDYRTADARELCNAIFEDVFAHRGEAPAFDDITVLVAKSLR